MIRPHHQRFAPRTEPRTRAARTAGSPAHCSHKRAGTAPRRAARSRDATWCDSKLPSPCPRVSGWVHTPLTSRHPGSRNRSPAIASNRPSSSFTPQNWPSSCVRARNGPGWVRVASASIAGASSSPSMTTLSGARSARSARQPSARPSRPRPSAFPAAAARCRAGETAPRHVPPSRPATSASASGESSSTAMNGETSPRNRRTVRSRLQSRPGAQQARARSGGRAVQSCCNHYATEIMAQARTLL